MSILVNRPPKRFQTKTPCSISPSFLSQHCIASPAAQEPQQLRMRTQLPSNCQCLSSLRYFFEKTNFLLSVQILPPKTPPFIHNWFPQHHLKSQALRPLCYLCSVRCLAKGLVVAQNFLFQPPNCGKLE